MNQSMWHASGPNAAYVRELGIFFGLLLGIIFVIVVGLALFSLRRRHRGIEQEALEGSHQASERTDGRLRMVVGIATALTVSILFGLTIVSVSVGKSISASAAPANSLLIEVTGAQWWWKIRYANDDPSRIIETANEIHIPTGRPVAIRGTADDVIHSFWVPSLQGKRDLIPGRTTLEWMQADQPGEYRGQCAEFCGLQHAHMAFWVIAEPPQQFNHWMDHQLQPAIEPADEDTKRGKEIFLQSACILCHAIRGTDASAQAGPDLTHFGSRKTIAAGTLPNSKGNLAGWIADPQNIKPGTHMATVPIRPAEMQPLIDYLESLK
uniref:Cytochrome aa3 subunit 2 n=1 Tax=Solibacter usitatus (strain Ellin6076) TaxID=234267 RepID=Q01R98_SOLUE